MTELIYLVPALGVVGLIVMAIKSAWVTKQDAGDAKMQELAGYIADGAMAFLKAEWKVLGIFVAFAAALLAYSGTIHEVNGKPIHSSWIISISFIIGAVFSATAGYIGMKVATKANVRTTQAARTSLKQALKVSFTGGTVMGLGVAGLAVLGLGGLFIAFLSIFADLGENTVLTSIEVLTGFSLGAESIALFARVGGGIYTKAADVGADLVGKVEAGIPEDDVRNPATIADNVGDNVGDVAGMGADLFGSYVATILATMVLGQEIKVTDNYGGLSPILLPMVICGLGIIFSIVGTWFVTIKDDKSNVQNALNLGNWSSMLLTVVASYFVFDMMQGNQGNFPVENAANFSHNFVHEEKPKQDHSSNFVNLHNAPIPASNNPQIIDITETNQEPESLSLEDKEIELIRKSLKKHHGKRKKAAQELGISERTLYRKIKQYDLE